MGKGDFDLGGARAEERPGRHNNGQGEQETLVGVKRPGPRRSRNDRPGRRPGGLGPIVASRLPPRGARRCAAVFFFLSQRRAGANHCERPPFDQRLGGERAISSEFPIRSRARSYGVHLVHSTSDPLLQTKGWSVALIQTSLSHPLLVPGLLSPLGRAPTMCWEHGKSSCAGS